MIPHHWSRSPELNQTADPNGQPKRGSYANQVLGIIRGLMTTAAASRDDHIGELVATLGASNVYTVTSNEGLIDVSTTGVGQTPAILKPFLLRMGFDTALAGTAANPAMLVADGAVKVPLLRRDGSPLRDGDVGPGRPYLVLGDMATPTDTTVTQARILDDLPSTVADAALAAGVGRRNRVLDPGFQVSQINGTTAVQLVSGTPTWLSDGVYVDWTGAVGGVQAQKIAGRTLSGANFFHRLTITAPNANPGASDRLRFVVPFEGQAVADLNYGASTAQPTVFSLDVRFPAGSYEFAVRNGVNATRSFCESFTILPAQNQTWTRINLPVPGDVAGSWATDTSRGMEICVSVLAGSGKQAAAGWQGNDYFGANLTPGGAPLTNGMASNGSTFDIAALDFSEGTAPQAFEQPDPTLELHKCRRWLRRESRYPILTDRSGNTAIALIRLDEPMRTQPQVTGPSAQKIIIPGTDFFTQAAAGVAAVDFTGDPSTGALVTLGGFSGLPAGVSGFSYPDSGQFLQLDARP